jgi:anti-sigma factor ChrR (cupin superfamily)
MDGITAKQLYVDPETGYVTMLIRMEPGASYPPHRHGGAEQCFVLEGDIHVGAGEILYAGDFQCMRTESRHEVQWTERGCLLLLISSPDDELLAH